MFNGYHPCCHPCYPCHHHYHHHPCNIPPPLPPPPPLPRPVNYPYQGTVYQSPPPVYQSPPPVYQSPTAHNYYPQNQNMLDIYTPQVPTQTVVVAVPQQYASVQPALYVVEQKQEENMPTASNKTIGIQTADWMRSKFTQTSDEGSLPIIEGVKTIVDNFEIWKELKKYRSNISVGRYSEPVLKNREVGNFEKLNSCGKTQSNVDSNKKQGYVELDPQNKFNNSTRIQNETNVGNFKEHKKYVDTPKHCENSERQCDNMSQELISGFENAKKQDYVPAHEQFTCTEVQNKNNNETQQNSACNIEINATQSHKELLHVLLNSANTSTLQNTNMNHETQHNPQRSGIKKTGHLEELLKFRNAKEIHEHIRQSVSINSTEKFIQQTELENHNEQLNYEIHKQKQKQNHELSYEGSLNSVESNTLQNEAQNNETPLNSAHGSGIHLTVNNAELVNLENNKDVNDFNNSALRTAENSTFQGGIEKEDGIENDSVSQLKTNVTEFDSQFDLDNRMWKKEKVENFATILCGECGISFDKFDNKETVKNHILLHMDSLIKKCADCARLRLSQYTLKRHLWRWHTGRSKVQCPTCKKYFLHKFNLVKHCQNYHSGKPPPQRGRRRLNGVKPHMINLFNYECY